MRFFLHLTPICATHRLHLTKQLPYLSRFDLACKSPEVLYEEVIEVDERVMLAEFYDENRSDEEIELLEQKSQLIQTVSPNYPKAGVGKRIKGVTGEKVGSVLCSIAVYRVYASTHTTV